MLHDDVVGVDRVEPELAVVVERRAVDEHIGAGNGRLRRRHVTLGLQAAHGVEREHVVAERDAGRVVHEHRGVLVDRQVGRVVVVSCVAPDADAFERRVHRVAVEHECRFEVGHLGVGAGVEVDEQLVVHPVDVEHGNALSRSDGFSVSGIVLPCMNTSSEWYGALDLAARELRRGGVAEVLVVRVLPHGRARMVPPAIRDRAVEPYRRLRAARRHVLGDDRHVGRRHLQVVHAVHAVGEHDGVVALHQMLQHVGEALRADAGRCHVVGARRARRCGGLRRDRLRGSGAGAREARASGAPSSPREASTRGDREPSAWAAPNNMAPSDRPYRRRTEGFTSHNSARQPPFRGISRALARPWRGWAISCDVDVRAGARWRPRRLVLPSGETPARGGRSRGVRALVDRVGRAIAAGRPTSTSTSTSTTSSSSSTTGTSAT